MTTTETVQSDEAAVEQFLGQVATDAAAVFHAATVVLGDKLGLYKALAEGGPATPAELAARTGCDERYLQEWLHAQAASTYCDYDASTGRFALTPAQAAVLADDASPAFAAGMMSLAAAVMKDEERLGRDAVRTGAGVGWHEHHTDLFSGTERLFKPGYVANLVTSWIPALEGVEDKLRAGATVADIGCGHGASTIVMAEAYPQSTFLGIDYHAESIDVARKRAADAGVSDRVSFEVASATDFSGSDYDLVCVFDALHDMGDPVGAASHVRSTLADDGTFLIVEPMAGERLEDNINPLGRLFYSAGMFICLAHAKSQGGAQQLGPQVPEQAWRELLADAGFSSFRRATETPFNRVFEARP
ncbi:MAG TPA: class I SAM-dependent methyltransferase [Acidimicrobiales bacterium]|jgi:SAM-dependent methyltransferase|nr:class I SAM-dependent methyltransferase [Acidimicrobiales bacterium]